MITVEEARKLTLEHCQLLAQEEKNVTHALDHYLSRDVISPACIPLFNQSAMDGYAFRYTDMQDALNITEKVPAGDTRHIAIQEKEAVRIYTGSKVPDCCDTVVMQELTTVKDGVLRINDAGLSLGGNIRKKGEQIKTGEVALQKGMKITPAATGFLSTLGLKKVWVHAKPKVSIIATGNELIKPGNPIKEGQVYESNTYMLNAALNKMGVTAEILAIKDDKETTKKTIEAALKKSDLLLLSGGISVGDYDFVKEALEQLGVNTIFHKVNQKPGKPLYYGKTNATTVFALPGNPAAALNCFYVYVHAYIKKLMGDSAPGLLKTDLPVNQSHTKKTGRAVFLKGITNNQSVTILEGQQSDMLQSFSVANCLIYLPHSTSEIKKGDLVEIHMLPV